MIKKVKDQTGKELTNADVDIILMKKEVSKIMKSTHATSCTPKDCQCGVDVIEYQLIAFISNALNQQRINLIKEILESKEVNALGLELPFPVWQSFKEFLTKLEK